MHISQKQLNEQRRFALLLADWPILQLTTWLTLVYSKSTMRREHQQQAHLKRLPGNESEVHIMPQA
jgi:hypothetical protein